MCDTKTIIYLNDVLYVSAIRVLVNVIHFAPSISYHMSRRIHGL